MAIVNSSQTAQIDRQLGEDGWYVITPGEIGKIRTSAADTNGAYTMLEVVAQPLNGVPVHIHTNEDEHFVILEGTLHFAKGDVKLDAPAGSTVSIRKGVPHAWCNISDAPVRMLIIFSPGHVEDMFRAIMAGASQDELAALTETFGTVITGPPMREDIFSFLSPRQ